MSPTLARPRVAALYVYPVKSLGGVSVTSVAVDDFGPAGDRRWMLVDDDGHFLTQRSDPRMALVRVELPTSTPRELTGFRASAPSLAELPALDVALPPRDAPRRRVVIWGDVVGAATYPSDVDAWFAAALGRPCHLVHMPNDVRRPVDPAYAGADDRTSFSDGFPVLVLSRESLAELNARLAANGVAPADERRFRPNVVAEGADRAFAEDAWREVQVGSARLTIVKPCARCAIPTVDPDTAIPSPRGEPLRTLATFRTRQGKVMFAQNALVRAAGTVHVGDEILSVD